MPARLRYLRLLENHPNAEFLYETFVDYEWLTVKVGGQALTWHPGDGSGKQSKFDGVFVKCCLPDLGSMLTLFMAISGGAVAFMLFLYVNVHIAGCWLMNYASTCAVEFGRRWRNATRCHQVTRLPLFFVFLGIDWKDAVAPLSTLSEIIDYLMGIYVPLKAASNLSTSVHDLGWNFL